MKILLVNTYHYMRGGDCRYTLGLGEMLTQSGHDVHYFAMQTPNDLPCRDRKFFVSEIDFRENMTSGGPIAALKVLGRSLYSHEARRKLTGMIEKVKPDIVHLNSIRHHLTKSILPLLAGCNIPIVWTLHDFKELCPNTSFYDGRTICEKCIDGNYMHVIGNRCKKGSFLASLVTYLEAVFNSPKRYDKYVDYYIAPSRFLKNKFISNGFDSNRMENIYNYLNINNFKPNYAFRNYLLFIGRLEKGKGLETMMQGFSEASVCSPPVGLKIVGTGSQREYLERIVADRGIENVEFTGFLEGKQLETATREAKAVIIPSELYENYPYSGLEAMAYGKPVIGSNIGGIPEQVEDTVTGFLYEPFNPHDLASKIDQLNQLSLADIREMGRKAREKVEAVNCPYRFLDTILNIYHKLIEDKQIANI